MELKLASNHLCKRGRKAAAEVISSLTETEERRAFSCRTRRPVAIKAELKFAAGVRGKYINR